MRKQFLASGTCGAQGDNLTWTLTSDGTLTISGKGDMEDYEKNFSWAPWYTYRIREQIRAAVLADGVTSIGNRAFLDCTELLLVIIPDGVMSIGEWAFSACRKLALVYIPDSVTSIGNYVFCGCTSLASVNISDSVTSIGDCAFSDCNSLTALYVSAGNPAYCLLDGVLFDKAQTILIAYLGGRKGSYVIPNGVTSIGDYAFDSSTELTSVTIPDGVTSIGDYAFYYCYGLTSVTIPDSVTNIGKSAFFGCESLTSVNIPDSVTSIGAGAFAGCESLTALYVSAGNPAYSSLNGVLFDKAQTTLIAYPVGWQGSSYAIPDGVTSIGDYAFYYCYGLTSVTIPESVTSIGECAFATTELTEIKVMATMPPSIIADKWGLNEATFKKVRKSIPVYVPAESIEAYRTAEGWSEFTNFLPLEDKER